ncbi:hypothetical protein Y032_0473g2086 [Ancylostoma ceylanicum]|uniref:Uncharacterized protein n=1 Tax=Ancylostoma ceylanicum TaxID=53326 RepID=A0A016WXT7_9BILA|nr:hypothetical protein Y032_0473g2086 [Ancylostoma ceylanicum]
MTTSTVLRFGVSAIFRNSSLSYMQSFSKILASCYTAHLLSRAAPPMHYHIYVLRRGSADVQCSVRQGFLGEL